MNLDEKHIILTGASSGIGFELLMLLQEYSNIKLIAVARNIDNIKTIPQKIYPFSADISGKEGIDQVFDYAKKTIGHIDIFIANAGIAYVEKLHLPDWKHIENIYQLNVFSPIYSLEKLIGSNPNYNKTFVCTISGAGLSSIPYYSLYCSTKAALHHFIETYRYEQAGKLSITAVYPIATKTQFFDKAANKKNFPLPFPQQEAKTVAKKIIRGIEKGKKRIYPSLLFHIFFPISRAFPSLQKLYSILEKRKLKDKIK